MHILFPCGFFITSNFSRTPVLIVYNSKLKQYNTNVYQRAIFLICFVCIRDKLRSSRHIKAKFVIYNWIGFIMFLTLKFQETRFM